MKFLSPKQQLLVIALFLVSVTSVARGQEMHPEEFQDEPWVNEVPCRDNNKREGRGWIKNREFRLCFGFQEKKLQPTASGTSNYSDLEIVSYMAKGGKNLDELYVTPLHVGEHPGLIIGKATPVGPERPGNLSTKRTFKVPIEVTNQVRSAMYPLAVVVTSGADKADQNVNFSMPILQPNSPLIQVEKKRGAFVDCWTGSDCRPLELEIRNRLPYNISISNISISSEDLLHNQPSAKSLTDIENNSPPQDLSVTMKAKSASWRRVFTGFGTPQVTMRIDYKDEYGRPLFTETTAPLEIRPNLLILAIFLILGATVGTFVRIDLGRLHRAGVISKRQRIAVGITTFVSGIVICLITLFANIKIIVLNDESSYSPWDPKILFFTALVATVSGLPILYAYLKLPRPADGGSPNPGSPNPPEPPK